MGVTVTTSSTAEPSAGGTSELDARVERLASHAGQWASSTIARRIGYLEELRRRTYAAADGWTAAACEAKGLAPYADVAGEEWGAGPWALLYSLNRYLDSLQRLEKQGRVEISPRMVRTRPDGQVVARVFPENSIDQFLLNGVQAEIWLEPGATAPEISDHVAGAYRGGRPSGRVALVLGAGNVSSIPPLDVLHKMLVEHRTVLLKMNPVNDYLGPIFEDVFEPLVKDGFMAIARGGPEVGAHLAAHPGIDEIHMTGSDRTHDAIVWGTDGEAIERKRRGTPLNERPVTSELGNVTPLIVVPGPWDAADLRFQAEHIATTKLHNSGFNCIATQVLVMPEAWDRGNDMIDAVREIFRRVPPRRAYYPGAAERQQAIAHSHPGAEVLDDRPANEVPRLLLTDLSAADPDEPFFTQECFVSSMGTVAISGASAADYLRNAVDFCNERLWGTLGVTILVHPATAKELGPELDEAIANLHYGSIGVNIWCGAAFLLAQLPWGAFPGHTLDDVQSGIGKVHNTRLFDRPQKSVIYAPFYPYPRSLLMGTPSLLAKPPWFVLHKRALAVNKRMTEFEYSHDPLVIRRMLIDAMLG